MGLIHKHIFPSCVLDLATFMNIIEPFAGSNSLLFSFSFVAGHGVEDVPLFQNLGAIQYRDMKVLRQEFP